MPDEPKWKPPQGTACLTPEQRVEIARKGGIAARDSGKLYKFTPEKAREAGRKGGQKLAERPGYMSMIGRKGGMSPRRKKPKPPEETPAQ